MYDQNERVEFSTFEPESVRVIKYSALAGMVAMLVILFAYAGLFAAVMALIGMGLTALLFAAYEAEEIAKANQRGRTDHP